MRMVNQKGVVETSKFTNISRSTLWRWKKYGINIKKRKYESQLFNKIKDELKDILITKKGINVREISLFFKNEQDVNISCKTLYKFIKRIGYSRKRIRTRGINSNVNLENLKNTFQDNYLQAIKQQKILVSLDECSFSEKLVVNYGYSLKGERLIIQTPGTWKHY